MIKRYSKILSAAAGLLLATSSMAQFDADVTPLEICVGESVTATLIAAEPGAMGHGVDFGDGSSATPMNQGSTVPHTYTESGTYYVIVAAVTLVPSLDTLASEVFQVVVNGVNDEFEVDPSPACPGQEVGFEYVGPFNSLSWDFSDGTTAADASVLHAFDAIDDYSVSLTIATDCGTETIVQTVEIGANGKFEGWPYVDMWGPRCPGTEHGFYADGGDGYMWDFSDGTTAQGRELEGLTFDEGDYSVSVTMSDECGNDTTVSLDFEIGTPAFFGGEPELNLNDDLLCTGASLYAEVDGIDGDPTYIWSIGGTAMPATDNEEFVYGLNQVGDYDIMVTVTNECGNDTVLEASIEVATSTGRFTGYTGLWSDENNVCPGVEIEYEVADRFASYAWDFDDGTTIEEGAGEEKHVFDVEGAYEVSVTLVDFCGNDTTLTESTTIITSGDFQGSTDIWGQGDVCPGEVFEIEAGNGVADHSWNLGDGTLKSTGPVGRVSHSYATTGTYNVSAILTDFCGNQALANLEVKVSGNIQVGDVEAGVEPDTICPGDAVYGWADGDGIVGYAWEMGDGGTENGQEGNYIYDNMGDYTITVTMTNACGNDASVEIDVHVGNTIVPDPDNYEAEVLSGEVCPGDSVLFVAFPTDAATYVFDFGDGTTAESENFEVDGDVYDVAYNVYDALDTYQATLTITNGCGNSINIPVDEPVFVTANQPVDGDMDINNWDALCVDVPVEMQAFGGADYLWDFGDGTTVQTAASVSFEEHTYDTEGNYTVQVTITNSCLNSDILTETIYVAECVNVSTGFVAQGAEMDLYPNPTTGAVQITWGGVDGKVNMNVLDMQGRVVVADVFSSNGVLNQVADLSNLEPGLYHVQLISNDNMSIKPVVLK